MNYNELEEMSVSEFQSAVSKLSGQPSPIYHFEGRIADITADCIDYVRTHDYKAIISVEVEKPKRFGVQELAQKADVVFYSKSWARVSGLSG